jgi:hypothetical protein
MEHRDPESERLSFVFTAQDPPLADGQREEVVVDVSVNRFPSGAQIRPSSRFSPVRCGRPEDAKAISPNSATSACMRVA